MSCRAGWVVIAMTAVVGGCADWGPQYCIGEITPAEAAPPRATSRVVAQVLPVESTAVDILFVIDDSMSMMDQQEQLGIWSREMFDVLSASGDLPDLHVGVTSSSVAIAGSTQCGLGKGGTFLTGAAQLQKNPYIVDVAGTSGRERNYSGSLEETFAKMARVGDGGCGYEQPFKAARIALSNQMSGFLRDEALLLVVFVTDEDDCSASDPALFADPMADACSELGTPTSYRCFEHGVRCYDGKGDREFGDRRDCRPDETSRYIEPVSAFTTFVKKLKANPAQVIVAGIYGKPNGIRAVRDEKITTHETPRLADVCGGNGPEGTGATPAVRLNAFLAEFGGRASQSSICDRELSWAMRETGLVARGAATRSHCLRGPIGDTDAITAGIQPTCRVTANGRSGVVSIPACRGSDGMRCFTIARDAACETETQLAFALTTSFEGETLTVDCDTSSLEP